MTYFIFGLSIRKDLFCLSFKVPLFKDIHLMMEASLLTENNVLLRQSNSMAVMVLVCPFNSIDYQEGFYTLIDQSEIYRFFNNWFCKISLVSSSTPVNSLKKSSCIGFQRASFNNYLASLRRFSSAVSEMDEWDGEADLEDTLEE